jgi:hypothetical protein
MEAAEARLSAAMGKGWTIARDSKLADLLGERHRIIANDWKAADGQTLIGASASRA